MKCADPVLVFNNSEGDRVYRNFSFASKSPFFNFGSVDLVFNCGKCLFCRRRKSLELACRCVLHASCFVDNCFLTLTYDESRSGYHNGFEYRDIQLFKKRLRQYVWREFKQRIQVFNVHEYGKNGKKHWHLIVFGFQFCDRKVFSVKNNLPLWISDTLSRLWPHGFSTIGAVEEASALYQAQYMEKDVRNGNTCSRRKSHSKHSGIGKPYFLKHYSQILRLGYVPFSGRRVTVPRYFEKLAHKHFAHFYEPSLFSDTLARRKVFTPFAPGEPNRDIADLYKSYLDVKAAKVQELEANWNDIVSEYLTSGESPAFILSNSNALYDLRNKKGLGF